MLQKLNERVQGLIAWVIIILIAVTFTLFGVDYYLQSHHAGNVKVVINDQPISNQEFETDYRRSRSQRDPSTLSMKMEKQLQKNVLEQIITNTVTAQAARKYGFEVDDQQANAVITGIRQFQQDGQFSVDRYKQALSNALYTPETFLKEVKQGMLLNQQRFAFIGSAFALPSEVKRFVRLYMQNRSYDYLIIPSSLFAKQVNIKDDAIKNYYEKHKEAFKTPEKVSLDYVQLSMNDIKSNLKITDQDVQDYYEENKSNYLVPAQWQVSHILFAIPANASETQIAAIKKKATNAYQQLEADPAKFKALLKTLSDDKLSIANEGKLPWLVAGQTEFDKALASLTKPNQISKPVKTKHGYEIFKLLAYKPAAQKPFAEVKDAIKAQLLAEKSQSEYARALEELSELSYQTPDSLEPVAAALKLKLQSTEPFGRKGGSTALTKNNAVINAAFSHDVLALENNSDAVQLDSDSVLILRVKEHFKETQKPLSSVQAEIKETLSRKAEMEQAALLAKKITKANEKEQSALMAQYHLNWKQVKEAGREDDKVNPLINALAFNLSKPGAMESKPLSDKEYTLVQLKAVKDGQLSTLDKEHQKSIAQQIEANYGMMAYDLYVNSLVANATIKQP